MPPLTFVTVVFDAELELLELQARSLRRHVSREMVGEIVVIDNSRRGLGQRRERSLREQYGHHAPSVRILRPREVADIPVTTGWYAQQVMKLMVADQIASDSYVVLDAKNHLVRSLEPDFFVSDDGRLRTSKQSFASHRLRPDLERTLEYFELPVDANVGAFTPTITPFVLRTDLVRAMVRDVSARAGRPFPAEFLRARLLEFFAYASWIIARRAPLEDVYVFDQPGSPTVWPKGATADGVETALEALATGSSPWFSVHRRALGMLEPGALARLANLWMAAGLFTVPEDAERFVDRARRAVQRGERRQRIADLLPKALRLGRRFTARLRQPAR